MKIHKPSYDSSAKLYTCELTDGFRLSLTKDDGQLTPDIETMKKGLANSLLNTIIDTTKGWFSKPLTEEWLKSRINFIIPTNDIPKDFEGLIEYQATRLIISKEEFMFDCPIIHMKPAEKVVIDFQEEVEDEIPLTSANPLGIGPTRRAIQKKLVMKTRAKAARALFHAERLTHEYTELYGEETDWEDEVSDGEEVC